ncbi:hypothetical protein CLV30_1283 [Haloactinopolyspora alba]|uniref:Uncharacterized protein n=1 Tax=Haloactinopolyspora alba TaxID=648780 RepID=A0A2P8DEW8_9ACTN|nr:hypothetical protein CLV30_1283 [Haloactinopolyspora alba]
MLRPNRNPRQGTDPKPFPGGEGHTMSWIVTTRPQHCAHCGTTTVHNVTIHDDSPREIVYCTECGQ